MVHVSKGRAPSCLPNEPLNFLPHPHFFSPPRWPSNTSQNLALCTGDFILEQSHPKHQEDRAFHSILSTPCIGLVLINMS